MQEDPSKKAKCNTKFEEVLFAIKQSICDDMLERIEDMKTPKEAWNNFASMFSKQNTHPLQLLEKEIGSLMQGKSSILEHFKKMKTRCWMLSIIGPKNTISDTKSQRILINGLRMKHAVYVAVIDGWEI